MISVCIPCRNEEKALPQCLASILDSAGATDLEIIVADNGSTDGSREVARRYGARVLEVPRACSVAELRNAAAKVASGELLVFTDADCVVGKDWVKLGLEEVRGGGVVGAYYKVPEDAHWSARTWYRDEYRKDGLVTYVPSSNLWISASLFGKVHGFNSSLRSSEDCDLCGRVRAMGEQVKACPNLAVCHLGAERSLHQFFRRQLWHGRSATRAFNLHAMLVMSFFSGACGGAVVSVLLRNGFWLCLFLLTMLGGALAIALRRRTSIELLPQLVLLCVVYGVARAACLIGLGSSRSPRQQAEGGPPLIGDEMTDKGGR